MGTKGGELKPDLATVALITWEELVPHGGATGMVPGSHRGDMDTILRATESGGISNARILVQQSLFGGRAVDPVAEEVEDKVMRPGDALFMHPHLTHSSAWNYQHKRRIASHIQVSYQQPLDVPGLRTMCERQLEAAKRHGGKLPPNTELYEEVLERYGHRTGCCSM